MPVTRYIFRLVRSAGDLRIVWNVCAAPVRHHMKHEARHMEDMVSHYPAARGTMIAVEHEGETIGGALGYAGSLCIIGLEEAHRRRGLGRRLLQTFEVQATTSGWRMISLGSDPENKRFFERLGYHGRHMAMLKEFSVGGRVFERRLERLIGSVGDLGAGSIVDTDADGRVPVLPGAY